MLKQTNKKVQQIQRDQQGDALMTTSMIRSCCKSDCLPQNPQLNDKLYLYQKGFKKIQSLQSYTNLLTLWLNSNKIAKIQNLQKLKNLVCLYLNNNNISKIQGLSQLTQLQVLNLQNNKISQIQNLQTLTKLKSLNLSQNNLSNLESIQKIKFISNLNNLDLSNNQIQNSQEVFLVFKLLQKVTCLSIKSTPFARGFKNYRKRVIAVLPLLKFFDDRPVQESDHRLCEAWILGGVQEEKKERNKIKGQQSSKKYENLYQKDKQYKIINKKDESKNQIKQNKEKIQTQSLNEKENHQAFSQKQNKNEQIMKEQEFQEIGLAQKQSQIMTSLQRTQQKSTGQHIKLENQWKLEGWTKFYYPILEALLQKFNFDFSQAQPQFNMILTEINKKLSRPYHRFQITDLQKVWNFYEIKRRREDHQ